jgi:hypothetical protein
MIVSFFIKKSLLRLYFSIKCNYFSVYAGFYLSYLGWGIFATIGPVGVFDLELLERIGTL